jgi:hypothetical protein
MAETTFRGVAMAQYKRMQRTCQSVTHLAKRKCAPLCHADTRRHTAETPFQSLSVAAGSLKSAT